MTAGDGGGMSPRVGDTVAVEAFGTVVEVRANGDVVVDLDHYLVDGRVVRPDAAVKVVVDHDQV
jgi:uncharacterized protein (AIM24 family)